MAFMNLKTNETVAMSTEPDTITFAEMRKALDWFEYINWVTPEQAAQVRDKIAMLENSTPAVGKVRWLR